MPILLPTPTRLAITAFVTLLLVTSVEAKPRVWTTADGQYKISAEYVRTEGDTIVLRQPDGELIEIGRSLLSQADISTIRSFELINGTGATTIRTRSVPTIAAVGATAVAKATASNPPQPQATERFTTPANKTPTTTSQAPARTGGASGKISQTLEGNLVSNSGGKMVPYDLATRPGGLPKYYAFYFSAHWCPPCRQFTPKLVNFYNRNRRSNVEVIFVSHDRGETQMQKYMSGSGMNWPAVRYGTEGGMPSISKYLGQGIPCLVLVDASGKIISNSYQGNTYIGPYKVLQNIEAIAKGT